MQPRSSEERPGGYLRVDPNRAAAPQVLTQVLGPTESQSRWPCTTSHSNGERSCEPFMGLILVFGRPDTCICATFTRRQGKAFLIYNTRH